MLWCQQGDLIGRTTDNELAALFSSQISETPLSIEALCEIPPRAPPYQFRQDIPRTIGRLF